MKYKLHTDSKSNKIPYSMSINGIVSYCGGNLLSRILEGHNTDDLTYLPSKTLCKSLLDMYGVETRWQGRLYMYDGDLDSDLPRIVMGELSAKVKRDVKVLTCGPTSHLVVLPRQSVQDVPKIPTEEEGKIFQDLVLSQGKKHVRGRGGSLKYITAASGNLTAISNASSNPTGYIWNSAVKPVARQSTTYPNQCWRIHLHGGHSDLPWWCPVNRKYNLVYRLREMIRAIEARRVATGYGTSGVSTDMTFIFDHWDLLSNSSSKLYRTIHELYWLQKDGQTSIKVGNDTVHFNVFMPNGVNPNYLDHACSGAAISLKHPITFEDA